MPPELQTELIKLAPRLLVGGVLYLLLRMYFAYLWRLFIARTLAGIALFVLFIVGAGLIFQPAYTSAELSKFEHIAFSGMMGQANRILPNGLNGVPASIPATTPALPTLPSFPDAPPARPDPQEK